MISIFSSKRERNLWLWVASIVGVIYATLGVAPMGAAVLRDTQLLFTTFVLGMVLVGLVSVTQGLKFRPSGIEIGVVLSVMGIAVLLVNRIISPEERTHLIEYGIVSILIYEALLERVQNGRRVPIPALLAILLTIILGWIDEGIQAFLPNRYYDTEDVIFNTLAALIAVGCSLILSQLRRWKR